ncbi:MAG: hypothetical protein P8X74_12745 [Reinekea sp.]
MLPKNWGESMAAPAIFEKQIEIKLLHSASTEEVTDSGYKIISILTKKPDHKKSISTLSPDSGSCLGDISGPRLTSPCKPA